MHLAVTAAEQAWDGRLGMWERYGEDLLARLRVPCIKLASAATPAKGVADAFQRVCVDLRTLKIVGKFGFPPVPPGLRLWVWEDALAEARATLGLHD
jgi:hypothetical protein